MVDSLFFQDGGFTTNYWREYKFVIKGVLSDRFKLHLERACVTASTHWTYTEGCVSDFYYEGTGEEMIGDFRPIFKCILDALDDFVGFSFRDEIILCRF